MPREDITPLLAYAPNAGIAAHREAGATWIARRGIAADPARVAVVAGAQNGMMLAIAALARPGDVVLTEALTFYGMKSIANLLGVRLVGVELDDDGLVPDALEAACRQHAPKAIYALPTFQNPDDEPDADRATPADRRDMPALRRGDHRGRHLRLPRRDEHAAILAGA